MYVAIPRSYLIGRYFAHLAASRKPRPQTADIRTGSGGEPPEIIHERENHVASLRGYREIKFAEKFLSAAPDNLPKI